MLSLVISTGMIDGVKANAEAISNIHSYIRENNRYQKAPMSYNSYGGQMKSYESDLGAAAYPIQLALSRLGENDLSRQCNSNFISESLLLNYVRVASGLKKHVSSVGRFDLSEVDHKMSEVKSHSLGKERSELEKDIAELEKDIARQKRGRKLNKLRIDKELAKIQKDIARQEREREFDKVRVDKELEELSAKIKRDIAGWEQNRASGREKAKELRAKIAKRKQNKTVTEP